MILVFIRIGRDRSYELPYRVEHDHDHSPSPDGRVALRVPADVTLGELMPAFLEVIGHSALMAGR